MDAIRAGAVLTETIQATFGPEVNRPYHQIVQGDDTFGGRPIRVRFSWSGVTTPTPRWEQAFSDDGGETWETNWVMGFTPAGGDG